MADSAQEPVADLGPEGKPSPEEERLDRVFRGREADPILAEIAVAARRFFRERRTRGAADR